MQKRNIIDLKSTPSKPRPTVLVFDSGVGGLSIYNEIRQLLPNLHYIYAFDNVKFPYGEKSEEIIIERLVEIVAAIQRCYPLALAVIACNTASIVSLPSLRKRFPFPVVGVVPAIKAAKHLTKNGVIGLLATPGTIKHSYTHELIARFANEFQIEMLGSSELVKLTEEKLYGKVVRLEELRYILQPWLCMSKLPDTIVLGCTHFPFLKRELLAIFPENTCLIDSGAAVARRTAWLLEHGALNEKSIRPNNAFCMALTSKTTYLLPVLRSYGFKTLEKLML